MLSVEPLGCSEKQEKEERIDAYRVDARNLEAQEARLRAGVLVTAPRVPQRYAGEARGTTRRCPWQLAQGRYARLRRSRAGARDELLRIARGEP